MKTTRIAPLAAALYLVGCGGGSSEPAPTFAVKGTVSGLLGSNLVLHLGPATPGQDLAVAGDGAFAFPGGLLDGSAYAVTVKTQPASPTQACVVSGGSAGAGGGTIAGADASVTVACATVSFPVGGTVSGLGGGFLRLQNNGGDDLTLDGNGPFTFAAPVASGATFAVTVARQPAAPSQTCAVAGGTGTVVAGPVTSVAVTCERNDMPVKGTITGLKGATGVVLQVNGAYDTTLTADGAFEVLTNLRVDVPWTLAVRTQPTQPWQTCAVTPGTGAGIMGATGAEGVVVTCATDAFAVGGTVTGLLQAGLSVSLTVGGGAPETISPAGDGSLSFAARVLSGQAFLVKVEASPPTQVCHVTAPDDVVAGTAVMAGAAVDVTVTCACAAGLASCSQVTQDGCEVDTRVDPVHCGGCNRPCAFPNGVVSCVAGACQLAGCQAGYGDCNLGAGDGCEADFSSDPAHCGSCLGACSFPNAGATCASQTCGLGTCNPGFGNCDGQPANGCEVPLQTSAAHCGACDRPCALANVAVQACAAGQCAVGSCASGFGNCDGVPTNGCEASFTTDPFNCGSCNRTCSFPNAAGVCSAGATCSLGACDTGWDDCNGVASDGCESQVNQDPLNCGACDNVCPSTNGTAGCLANQCTMTACDPGFLDCRGAAVPGCETVPATDPLHCGSCGRACAAGQICDASTCVARPSCNEILLAGESTGDGTYTIDPDGAGAGPPVQVWCDMTTDDGGWTFFAHVNDDYQAGPLFEVDLGTYDPARGDGNVSYGVGGSVYQKIGATELMVSIINPDPAATLGKSLVFYQFGTGPNSFNTGPIPSDITSPPLLYRTLLGSYLAGTFINGDTSEWYTFTEGGEPLIWLYGGVPFGTGLGSGIDPSLPPNTISSVPWDSWWYAR